MNKYQAHGAAIYLLGKVQENIGRLTGCQRQAEKGFDKQICGKAKMAIGEAQHIINDCNKRRYHPG